MRFALIYRKNKPYPIRHVISDKENRSEEAFLAYYHKTFRKFEDDTVEFYPTLTAVLKRESELCTQMRNSLTE